MKNLLIISLSFFCIQFGIAQTVTITNTDAEIDKISRPGLETTIELDKKRVKEDWKKFLKKFGKVETSGSEYTLSSAKIPALSSQPVSVVSKVEKGKKGITVFWAIDLGDKWISKDNSEYKAAEQMLHDFGVSAYKNEINDQIKEAEKALKRAEKAKDKSIKEGGNLENKLKKNKEDKIKLENDLVKNKEDKVQLEQDIVSNKKDQESQKENVGKVSKALDKVKDKLNHVH